MKIKIILLLAVVVFVVITVYGQRRLSSFERQKRAMRDPNRIVEINKSAESYDAPAMVNAFFACNDINSIYAEKPDPVYGDREVLYQQEPWTGFVMVQGQKFSCRAQYDGAQGFNIGTIEPGEEKTVTVTTQKP